MSSSDISKAAIPEGSVILVTGVNGFIGSHVANELLRAGYNVRGSVREAEKQQWVADMFERKYGSGRFALLSITDMTQEDAFATAVRGMNQHLFFPKPSSQLSRHRGCSTRCVTN